MSVCRPCYEQSLYYCVHHENHVLKFLFFWFVNGMCVVFGPFPGRQNDAGAALSIGLPGLLKRYFCFHEGTEAEEEFSMLADGGFGICQQVLVAKRVPSNRGEVGYNNLHRHHRVCVEWGIGMVTRTFRKFNFASGLQINNSPIASEFIIAAHLVNV